MDKDRKLRNDSDEIWVLEFTPEAAQEFRDRMMEESQDNPNKPIIVYVDSYGGQVDALAKMIATMDEIPNPIITCCMGKAMSCGAILLSHGDIRFIDPHSRVMVHKVSGIAAGDVDDIKNDSVEISRLNKYWLDLLAANCNIKGGYDELDKLIKEKDGRDRFMTADDAVKFGVADTVGLPRIAAISVYEVLNGPTKMPIKKRAALRAKYVASNPLITGPKTKKSRK